MISKVGMVIVISSVYALSMQLHEVFNSLYTGVKQRVAVIAVPHFLCTLIKQFNMYFKLYLFYNNNTQLQIGHEVIFFGEEWIGNIFGQEKPLEFLPWMKNPNLIMPAVEFKPMTSQ